MSNNLGGDKESRKGEGTGDVGLKVMEKNGNGNLKSHKWNRI